MKFKNIFILVIIGLLSCEKKNNEVDPFKNPLIFVVGGSNQLDIIDPKSLEVIKSLRITSFDDVYAHHIYLNNNNVLSIALPEFDFSEGHNGLHGSTKKGGVSLLNAQTGEKLKEFKTPFVNHNAVLNPAGTEVWTSEMSHKGRVDVFEQITGKLLKSIIVDADPGETIFSEDGKYVFVACQESSFLTVISADSKEVVSKIKVDPYPSNVYKNGDIDLLVINGHKKSINFINSNTLSVDDFIDLKFIPGFAKTNPKTNELWICPKGIDSVFVYKKQDGQWQEMAKISSVGDPHQLSFFNDNSKAIIINQKAGNASIIDVMSKSTLKIIDLAEKPNGIAIWE